MSPAAPWEAVIGLEVHVQLATRSKLFSAAPVPGRGGPGQEATEPNSHLDPVVLGLPGVLPTLNRHAVELALRVAVALGAEVQRRSSFARKHYFYPDLPKGYQITQGEAPLALGGSVHVDDPRLGVGGRRRVPLERLHLEEDAGKSLHAGSTARTLVDFDRAGVPLVEIVTAPAIRSPEEAEAVFRAIREVAVAVGATEGDLERGHLRCDANVSVRRRGAEALGPKVEVKNLNSFRFVRRALAFEVARQIAALEAEEPAGEPVTRETRTWDDAARRTIPTRRKERGGDYRYLYEPDLMPLVIEDAWVERVRQGLPELPAARRRRLEERWGLDARAAATLGADPVTAARFEALARGLGGGRDDGREAAKWLLGDLRPLLSSARTSQAPGASGFDPTTALLGLLRAARRGALTATLVRAGLAAALEDPGLDIEGWVAAQGGVSSRAEVDAAVARVVAAHPREVAAYRAGKKRLLGFFMGAAMRALGGRGEAQLVREALERHLRREAPIDGADGPRGAHRREDEEEGDHG